MAIRQFDICRNPDPASAAWIPYFVVLQADAVSHLTTRIVAPLVSSGKISSFERLMPEVQVAQRRYVVDMTNIGVIAKNELAQPVENLESQRYRLVAAIDLLFTGI
jgi:mRNA-degrading endonuclease toxin of MazEF toxin-antitoxin module